MAAAYTGDGWQVMVDPLPDGKFEVTVSEIAGGSDVEKDRRAGRSTTHTVSVPAGLARDLGCEGVPEEDLVRESFGFLLEREAPQSILRRFSLEVIGDYFPEYHREMSERCARRTTAGES
jgi:hypothetical protein